MQELFSQNRTFFQRTDILAARMGINVGDLAEKIGVSRRTLFECRSADGAVSRKTWLKLEAAERAAGVVFGGGGDAAEALAAGGGIGVADGKVKYLAGSEAKKTGPDYEAAFWDAAGRLPLPDLIDMAERLQARKPPGYEAILDRLLPLMKSRMAGLDPAAGKDNIPSPTDTP